jgi:hypothetical protein
MKPFDRELLVLFNTDFMSGQAIEDEVEKLHYIFQQVESVEMFCQSYELGDRFGITQKKSRLENVYYRQQLKTFEFLICKN